MSYYYREKPSFSERLRGKSGDELLEEIKQQFDDDDNSFFESRNARDPFKRHAGIPKVQSTFLGTILLGVPP